MEALKTLGGGAFVHMTFQVETAFPTAGVIAVMGLTGNAGVNIATTTGSTNAVGLTVNTALANDANLLTVIVNPDLVVRAKLSGGATADTALTIGVIDSGGTQTTTSIDVMLTLVPNSPEMDEGIIWGYSGTNAGLIRAVSATDANTVTILNALPNAAVEGDEFLMATRFPMQMAGVVATTLIDQVNAAIAVSTDDDLDFLLLDGEFNTVADEGSVNSFFHLYSVSHALHQATGLA